MGIKSLISTGTTLLKDKTLVVRKHSPEILVAVGIGCVIGSTIMVAKAAPKAKEINESYKIMRKEIHEMHEDGATTTAEFQKDLTYTYAVQLQYNAKLYGPALALQAAGICCFISSNRILASRGAVAAMALTALKERYEMYREEIREKLGEDEERDLNYKVLQKFKEHEKEVSEEREANPKKAKKVYPETGDYARYFDRNSANWCKNPEYNMNFLRGQQNYANDMLRSRGHVFLNEVYDLLGIPRSKAGALVGWVYDPARHGNNYIDFGLYDSRNADFINGYESAILLDFNVDGLIYNLL